MPAFKAIPGAELTVEGDVCNKEELRDRAIRRQRKDKRLQLTLTQKTLTGF